MTTVIVTNTETFAIDFINFPKDRIIKIIGNIETSIDFTCRCTDTRLGYDPI